jgi:hypothetical protein
MTTTNVYLCPHCRLSAYEDDPNTIWRGRALYHGPCWALCFADSKDSP